MNLLWLDFETSGLKPELGAEIIDLCATETDREGNIVRSFHSKVKPTRPVSQEAAAVNGYTEEKWRDAPAHAEVLERLRKEFPKGEKKAIPAGWTVEPFDLSFVRFHCPSAFHLHYHPFDLLGYGWDRIADIDRPHLEHLCRRLGVEVKDAHTAKGDVDMMIECYRRLRKSKAA